MPGTALSSQERKNLLDGLFQVKAFQMGSFTLKSGQTSPFYLDLRRIPADPALLRLAGRAYGELLGNIKAQRLAGIPVAALPLAAAAALEMNMSLIYPRMEKKAHGSGARIEGDWTPGQQAVLLDDLITTGGSKLEAAKILREAGLVVTDLVVLLERGKQGRLEMEQAGIKLHSWARLEELLDRGRQRGWLSREDQEAVLTYVQMG